VGELQGQLVERLLAEPLRLTHEAFRVAYGAAPQWRPMEHRSALKGVRKDGSSVWVRIGLNPLNGDGRRLVTAVVRTTTR